MPAWFRFYSETTTDRKIERICRVLEQPKALVIGAWSILMSIGNDSPVRGVLLLTEDIAFTDDDLADEMGLDLDVTRLILDQFQHFRMVHRDNGVMYLTNWDKRQFASDDSSERVRRYRERKRAEQEQDCNDDVTLQDRDGNAPEQNRADTETDTEAEQIIRTGENAAPDAPPPKKPAQKRQRPKAKDPPPQAVARYRAATHLFPEKSLWDGIVQVIGDEPKDLDRWQKVCTAWVAMGWNKRNVKGMLQHYAENRIPGEDGRGQNKPNEAKSAAAVRAFAEEQGVDLSWPQQTR